MILGFLISNSKTQSLVKLLNNEIELTDKSFTILDLLQKIEDLKSKELLQLAYLNGYDINEILKPNDFNFGGNAKLNMILFDRYVKQWSKLQSIISGENFFEDLEQFELLRKGGQEITDVAAMLKINQGLGVTALDKVNFITKSKFKY